MNLIELVFAIVIISIAAVGVLLVYAQALRFSADPMVQQQALAVAEGYLDEILARPATNPTPGVAETGGSEEGDPSNATVRPLLNDVLDYNGLSNLPPQDQNGNTLALSDYQVTVVVTRNVTIGGVAMQQVDVRVRYGTVVDLTLTGYRACASTGC